MKKGGMPGAPPLVCYVTDRNAFPSADALGSLLDKIRHTVSLGIDWVQVREKDLHSRTLLDIARQAVALAAPATKIILNDRLDIAIASGAAGVHLGHQSLPTREAARWCRAGNAPSDFLVGTSCHSLEEAYDAQSVGASYIFFGPIFATPSKQAWGPPQGISRLAEVCHAVRLPVVAIGGIDETNANDCLRAGARGIAAIRLFQESEGNRLRIKMGGLRGKS
jgi:thiamine-phosphate pyrophosphorylase